MVVVVVGSSSYLRPHVSCLPSATSQWPNKDLLWSKLQDLTQWRGGLQMKELGEEHQQLATLLGEDQRPGYFQEQAMGLRPPALQSASH